MHPLRYYRRSHAGGYCCICGSLTNMIINDNDYLCEGFGMGGLNPGSDAFCIGLYLKRKIRDDKNIGE